MAVLTVLSHLPQEREAMVVFIVIESKFSLIISNVICLVFYFEDIVYSFMVVLVPSVIQICD